MTKGFNPMRWLCERDGCFNVKRRPKIEAFADCFPRRINFGDVDGIVELNKAFCLLEWKGDGGSLHMGQRLTYEALTSVPRNVVFVVHGDAETMAVKSYGFFWKGQYVEKGPASLGDVKRSIARWVQRVTHDHLAQEKAA